MVLPFYTQYQHTEQWCWERGRIYRELLQSVIHRGTMQFGYGHHEGSGLKMKIPSNCKTVRQSLPYLKENLAVIPQKITNFGITLTML